MLKIVAIGNLTNDVELKVHEATGKPYAILRIASDRRYRDKEGKPSDGFYLHQGTRPLGGTLCGVCLEGLQAGSLRRFRDHHL